MTGLKLDNVYVLENLDSEEMASYIHFLLTVTVKWINLNYLDFYKYYNKYLNSINI